MRRTAFGPIMPRIVPILVILLFIAAVCLETRSKASRNASAGPSGYQLLKKIPAGGDGGWDYLTVDAGARRLYISRGTRVMVFDLDSEKMAGEIPNTNGVHGIAIASDLGRGFTSNGRDNSVTIFDLKTLNVLNTVKISGKGPDAIIYDSASHRVFTFNGGSKDATAIDAKTGYVAGTVTLTGRPEFACADEKGMVFANLEDKNELVAIDSNKLAVKSEWSLGAGQSPTGLAMDRKHHRLFSGCAGNQKMIVLDSETGRIVADLPIGRGVDATAFDHDKNLAFASAGDGTLTIIHEDSPDKFEVLESVPTQRLARTMALDSKSHNVYLVTAEYGPPPAATAGQQQRQRGDLVPNSFTILVVGK
jgi:DNA-binding beta-propeller fold protein YncE